MGAVVRKSKRAGKSKRSTIASDRSTKSNTQKQKELQPEAKVKMKAKASSSAEPRKVKSPTYKSFRLSKRISQPKPKLPSGRKLLRKSLGVIWGRKKLFLGILLVYFVASLVLVKGLSITSNLQDAKYGLDELVTGGWDRVLTGAALFSVLLGAVNNPATEVGGAYQSFLFIGASLAVIWAMRQSLSQKKSQKIQVRDAFYKGFYPLVPLLVVVIVMGLQMIPVAVANFLYSIMISGGLAVTSAERLLWVILIVMLVVLSLYMVCSSLFAVYIVTLPDIRPVQALKSARELVRFRRVIIFRRLVFLPAVLLVSMMVIVVPVIFLSPNIAEWLFFLLSMASLVVAHGYLYMLYRELL
ncbi:hypothetical protein KA068_01135 [Candidatus Saccharibacteria bacterium]|nr:hypothetical protein [Candidatus Saccharibacteria bacterium]